MERAELPDDDLGVVTMDLFGRPVVALRDRRGRPSYAITEENQRFVAVRAAAGWSTEMIAEDMKADPKTVRKHFSRELSHGMLMVEGELLDALYQRSRSGHVPSIRRLQDRLDRNAPAAPRADQSAKPGAAKLGKKAQAVEDAQLVPKQWGDIIAERDRRN